MGTDTSFHSVLENSPEVFKEDILRHLKFTLARDRHTATRRDWYLSTCSAIQDRIVERLIATQAVHNQKNVRRVYYLSLEFLMGRLFTNSLYNAGVYEEVETAMKELGFDVEGARNEEYDMGLGNGGLGRLAACFLDSLATLDYPAIGYGIRYEYGLFKQEFQNGHQVELPDDWAKFGVPWEICRPQFAIPVELYGNVENIFDDSGSYVAKWVNTWKLLGTPYDIPIPGYGTPTVNFLRLWESGSTEDFDFAAFNQGGYSEAVRDKNFAETITKILYPNDSTENGKELRLVQQYFFVSCSLKDIVRRFHKSNRDWKVFPEKVAIQLNDTHPAIAVAELMRLLHDEDKLPWEQAWSIVTSTFSYTNHTLLPEALEKWSVGLFEKVLPRHMQIIYEINKRFLAEVEEKWPGDDEMKRRLSLIEESGEKMVRMAYLAVVGSHTVNGVAALHSRLLKQTLFADFESLNPDKIVNVTNGITPRRWLQACNPRLSTLITEHIGTEWARNLDELRKLEPFADDASFQERFMATKHENKVDLAEIIKNECGVVVDPHALFDVQIKRLHEYKRQHLNLLNILSAYRRILQNPDLDIQPRVYLFAAKAAPGYALAKCIIKAINAVGEKINNDPKVKDRIKVIFLPNYRVSLAQRIIPASDLSEQISTAGKEASGTGNMKLALNGSLTIGTLDGANVEIKEQVGDENIFIFGMTVEEVTELKKKGYNPHDYYQQNEEIRTLVDWIGSNYFTPDEHGALSPLRDSFLTGGDPFMILADFESYKQKQLEVDTVYRDKARWAKMAILNTARIGFFSSDRTIREYAEKVWKLKTVPV
ncbi:MAG: glycogen/starch/alpha-glucan phosphorylase [Verrucomicrobiota bacterium]